MPEDRAERVFGAEGKRINGVRVVELNADDARLDSVRALQSRYWETGSYFYSSALLKRRYERRELESAELLHLTIAKQLDFGTEELGTSYDYSNACEICGFGRKRLGPVFADTTGAKGDVARTLDEVWIVSRRLAAVLEGIEGVHVEPLVHVRRPPDTLDPTSLPSGQELLRVAEAEGIDYPGPAFWEWIQQDALAIFVERMRHERREALPRPAVSESWFYVEIRNRVRLAASTRFGIDPLTEDVEGRFRCPWGHVSGLRLLSEPYVARDSWNDSDLATTVELVGIRQGLLRPAPLLVTSSSFWRRMTREKIRGFDVEIARVH